MKKNKNKKIWCGYCKKEIIDEPYVKEGESIFHIKCFNFLNSEEIQRTDVDEELNFEN